MEHMVKLMKKRCKNEGAKKSENLCQKGGQKIDFSWKTQ